MSQPMRYKLVPRIGSMEAYQEHMKRGAGSDPALHAVLATRGTSLAALNDVSIHPPTAFAHIEKSASIISEACDAGAPIAISGDYDADGITATAVLVWTLREMGVEPHVFIPERTDGYGFSTETVERFYEQGCSTIITVDSGVRAFGPVARARELGMRVILTDHHELSTQEPNAPYVQHENGYYPRADAFINPKVDYPFRDLAGVGAAAKLALYLLDGRDDKGKLRDWIMALTAFGTITDSVPLIDENRAIVKEGLQAIASDETVPGLLTLRDVSGLDNRRKSRNGIRPITAHDIGFTLGPRINAGGRMGEARLSLRLLTSQDIDAAYRIAMRLEELNKQRRALTRKQVRRAEQQLRARHDTIPPFVVVWDSEFHLGVLGLIASRLVGKTGRPAAAINVHNGTAKGSARSVAGFSLIDVLTEVSDLFLRYGGHEAAAGFSLRAKNIEALERRLGVFTQERLGEDCVHSIEVDGSFPISEAVQSVLPSIEDLRPFGVGNPEPTFHDRVLVQRLNTPYKRHSDWAKIDVIDSAGTPATTYCYNYGAFKQRVAVGAQTDLVYTVTKNRINSNAYIKAQALLAGT